ncbi:hypothetical protein V8C86DRAFT_3030586 [Haematococcus lacustris]
MVLSHDRALEAKPSWVRSNGRASSHWPGSMVPHCWLHRESSPGKAGQPSLAIVHSPIRCAPRSRVARAVKPPLRLSDYVQPGHRSAPPPPPSNTVPSVVSTPTAGGPAARAAGPPSSTSSRGAAASVYTAMHCVVGCVDLPKHDAKSQCQALITCLSNSGYWSAKIRILFAVCDSANANVGEQAAPYLEACLTRWGTYCRIAVWVLEYYQPMLEVLQPLCLADSIAAQQKVYQCLFAELLKPAHMVQCAVLAALNPTVEPRMVLREAYSLGCSMVWGPGDSQGAVGEPVTAEQVDELVLELVGVLGEYYTKRMHFLGDFPYLAAALGDPSPAARQRGASRVLQYLSATGPALDMEDDPLQLFKLQADLQELEATGIITAPLEQLLSRYFRPVHITNAASETALKPLNNDMVSRMKEEASLTGAFGLVSAHRYCRATPSPFAVLNSEKGRHFSRSVGQLANAAIAQWQWHSGNRTVQGNVQAMAIRYHREVSIAQ